MQQPLNIVILAAGKGSRMYSNLPKVLHPIGGKPMLERVIDTANKLAPENIIVIYGHGGEEVKATINQDVIWAEQTEQLGTGHALKMALPHLPNTGKTLVLYGDVPLISANTLQNLLDVANDGVALLTDHLSDPTGYGRIERKDHQIVGVVEEKDASVEQKAIIEINTGFLVLPNHHLNDWLSALQNTNTQGEYYLTDVISLAVNTGVNITGVNVPNHFEAAGVNNKIQLAALERVLQTNQAHELLSAGVTLLDPERFDLRGTVTHGQDLSIDVNVVLSGSLKFGHHIQIGANCVLKNVTLGDNVTIEPFSHLEDCIIESHSQIGPFARLRPKTHLSTHTKVGNFVEIKNSHIGKGSKVNHLSYIGDATIGKNSNIGAGTITCNYDGVNKFKTQIGNQVFVGSGTMLVAPITLNDGVTIGAGSVINKNCETNTLNLARSRQVCIKNWQRPVKIKKD